MIAEAPADGTQYKDFTLYGGLLRWWQLIKRRECPAETLIEGPAGSGKSFAILLIICWLCEQFPGVRVLVARKYMTNARETVLAMLEDQVLPPGHPAKRGHNRTAQHPRYEFSNGSLIITAGFDDVERIKSSEYDVVYVNEGTEITLHDWNICLSRLRHHRLPLGNFGVIDCNPGAPAHWLNQRADTPKMARIKTTLDDNPKYVDPKSRDYTPEGREYLVKLDNLSGHDYQRLRLGLWVAAEGAIWPNYDKDIHIINDVPKENEYPVTDWFVGMQDWGHRNPGVFLVAGVNADTRQMYVVRQWYRRGWNANDWAEVQAKAYKTYNLRVIVADSADSGSIDICNRRLMKEGARNIVKPCEKPPKAFPAMCDLVRQRFEPDWCGKGPGLFFVRGNLQGRDPGLVEDKQPTCTEEEIPSYVWREHKDGQAVKEEEAPDSVAHGCFVAGTLIATLDGLIPIERVGVGQKVWTPSGPRQVAASGMTGIGVDVLSIELEDGREVTCTPDHKFWTDRGWIRADALRYGDRLASCMLSIEESVTPRAQTATFGVGQPGGAITSGFTDGSTRIMSDRFLRVGMYTTSTATFSTTILPTWRPLHPRFIHANAIRKVWNALGRLLRRGMAHPRVALGTASTPPISTSGSSTFLSVLASGVGASSSRGFTTSDSVPTGVVLASAEQVASMTRRDGASGAGASFGSTSTRRPAIALAHVQRVYARHEKRDVYDLTVEGEHVYFANGVLASNCDCLRYGVWYLDGTAYRPKDAVVVDRPGTVGHFLELDKDEAWKGLEKGKRRRRKLAAIRRPVEGIVYHDE